MTGSFFFILIVLLAFGGPVGTARGDGDAQAHPRWAIDERSFVTLGGEPQYVEITGASTKNPVLLFIHGGPGWPQTPQLRYFSSDLARDVTLVVWEQRGAGKSFMKDPEPKNVTLEQIVADGHELTQNLKQRFGQEKIYLAGYSWGSIVGVRLASEYPEDYEMYIGIAQSVNVQRGMEITQAWLAKKATEAGDTATLAVLEKLKNPTKDFCDGGMACFVKQYELVEKYHGAVFNPDSEKEIEASMTEYDDYRDYDWMKAFEFSSSRLEKDLLGNDLRDIKQVNVPVVLFLGRHDWNVPAVLAEEFLNNLQAPRKEIVWFENSGHELLEEEPQRFNREIVRVVTGAAK